MKSGRQRRVEIQGRRQKLAKAALASRQLREPFGRLPKGALLADQSKLLHDGTYGPRPAYYVDKPFTCIDCSKSEIWTAAQQRWWYEEAKGKIGSTANRCRECRRKRRLRSSQERRIHIEGLLEKYGDETTAKRLHVNLDALDRMRERWDRD